MGALLIRRAPRVGSVGHASLIAAFLIINFSICFTNVVFTTGSIASRTGWMAIVNLCLLVFLALKNTPLAFLVAYSYDKLNCLHQVAGYTMFLFMAIHSIAYTSLFSSTHRMEKLREEEQIAGIFASFAFLTATLFGVIRGRVWYEAFYAVHVMTFAIGLVCTCLHQPMFSRKGIIVLLLTAAMWITDRAVRIARTLYYACNNTATVYPLPKGGTKVVVRKVPRGAVSGQHVLMWLPSIRCFQMHPFTIVDTQQLEFVIMSHDGFTRKLHSFAQAHPGSELRVSIDGPYGTSPDPLQYDKIVLIGGGSGASFTFGLAANLLGRMDDTADKSVVFIWTVRDPGCLGWFTQHVDRFRTHQHSSKVNVCLHVTGTTCLPPESSWDPQATPIHSQTVSPTSSRDTEKGLTCAEIESVPVHDDQHTESSYTATDVYRRPAEGAMQKRCDNVEAERDGRRPTIKWGRPDLATLIREAVDSTPQSQSVLIAACGPEVLMEAARSATADAIRVGGPAVDLHCERFSW